MKVSLYKNNVISIAIILSKYFHSKNFLNFLQDILVNMLKKEKKRAADAVGQLDRLGQTPNARPGSSYSEGGLTNGHSKFVTEREDQGSDKRTASVNMGHNKSHTTKERATSDIEEKTKKKICKFRKTLTIQTLNPM